MYFLNKLPADFVRFSRAVMQVALVMTFLLVLIVESSEGQPCVPPCEKTNLELRNESGATPSTYVGAGSTTDVMMHATRFIGQGLLITHVCVAAKSPSGGATPNEQGVIFFTLDDLDPVEGNIPSDIFLHTTGFTIEVLAGFQLVELSSPVSMNSPFWAGVSYPTATAGIGHQGTVPRTSGKAMVRLGTGDWINYDNTGNSSYINQTPSIGLYSFVPCVMNVSPTAGLMTDETGATAQFTISLNCMPTSDVNISIISSDPSEGIPLTGVVTINAFNWTTPQIVTIQGQDDNLDDGDIPYQINLSVSSGDLCYDGASLPSISLTNLDDDGPCCDLIGDIDGNGVAYEVADAVRFSDYFVQGLSVLGNLCLTNTDVDGDGVVLMVADLVYLINVINGDESPVHVCPCCDMIGDIDGNGVAYEVADATTYSEYFVSGISVVGSLCLTDTDVDGDGLFLTVADLVYLINVINGDESPVYACSGCCDTAGDANNNGTMNIADAIYIINRVFGVPPGPAPPCCEEGDANGNGTVNIADAIYIINTVFNNGPAPICGPAGMGC